MAINYLEVDTGSLSSDSSGMEEQIGLAKISLEELKEELAALNGMWQGRANLAFRQQVNKDIASMAEILDNLLALANSSRFAVKAYNLGELEVMGEINNIKL